VSIFFLRGCQSKRPQPKNDPVEKGPTFGQNGLNFRSKSLVKIGLDYVCQSFNFAMGWWILKELGTDVIIDEMSSRMKESHLYLYKNIIVMETPGIFILWARQYCPFRN